MALASGTLFNVTATATTGNVNGAGFNPAATFGITDATTDANTANTSAPIVSSATYTFVAGDVGAWLYVKSGTSWTPGFYPISSVSGGKATINATIGSAWQLNSATGMYAPSTVVGCATVGTPTSGTIGVNYAGLDTAIINGVADFASVGASTTLTSATAGFTIAMIGNFFHLTTTGTGGFGLQGWYEITAYTNATTVTTDRTTNNGTALAAGTGYVGGAGRLNGTGTGVGADAFHVMLPSAAMVWTKGGTYTLGEAITTANTNKTTILSIQWVGYTTVPGDTCNGSSRPLIAAAANVCNFGGSENIYNFNFTTTEALGIGGTRFINCKVLNSSTTASRHGFNPVNGNLVCIRCECISQNGSGVGTSTAGSVYLHGNYIHDSATGINNNGANGTNVITNNIFEAISGTCIGNPLTTLTVIGNTLYGREAKMGTGISISQAIAGASRVYNNIFYGLTTGITVATGVSGSGMGGFNDFFNNTTDATSWNKDPSDLAVNPTFTGATQLTGTGGTATGGTSTLTDSGADFSTVTDNVDFVRITSATGGTGTIVQNYLITGHTGTTLTTNNAIGASGSITAINYFVTTGHNFQIGTNLKAAGFPNFANVGSETTSYPDVGAVQRQEAGAAGGSYTFVG